MKTLIVQNGVVVNVGVGEPETAAPEGFTFIVVPDGEYVGTGFTVNEDGSFIPPIPPARESIE